MTGDALAAFGDGSLVVVASVLIVREVLSWVDKRKNGGVRPGLLTEKDQRNLRRALEIVTATSDRGMPLVYRHPDTQEILVALSAAATTQTAILRDMQKAVDRLERAKT